MGCSSSTASSTPKKYEKKEDDAPESTESKPRPVVAAEIEKVEVEPVKEGPNSSPQAKPTPTPTTGPAQSVCRLRILHINDVYELEEFPRIATMIEELKQSDPDVKTISTLAGDFLAPSLLSSMDQGCGIVDVMNHTPIDMVCFGNHEGDVPQEALCSRIQQYKGVWLNSNMPDFQVEPPLPTHHVIEVASRDQTQRRMVAFLGLLISNKTGSYRNGVFGGAVDSITDVNESAVQWHEKLANTANTVIPLTHQDLPDDVKLAETGRFPVILAGHDHDEHYGKYGSAESLVVKAGKDGHKACVIDLEWGLEQKMPRVKYKVLTAADYKEKADVKARVDRHNAKIEALKEMMLYKIPKGETLSSKDIRYGQRSVGTFLSSILRDQLGCDMVALDASALRGNNDYTRVFTYADLKAELFFESIIDVIPLPGGVVRDMVRQSREGDPTSERCGFLQVDDGVTVGEDHVITQIKNQLFEEDQVYNVGVLHVIVDGINDHKPFLKWLEEHPELKPTHDEFGAPAKPQVVQWAAKKLWKEHLPKFEEVDADKNGSLSIEEVKAAYIKVFESQFDDDEGITESEKLGIESTVRALVDVADKSADGRISKEEYHNVI